MVNTVSTNGATENSGSALPQASNQSASSQQASTKNIGLRGIPVADTRICDIDGEQGILIYRGYNVVPLAEQSTYEEVVYLLSYGNLPSAEELAQCRAMLAGLRPIPESVLQMLKTRPAKAHPMDVLQSAVPMLVDHEPDLRDDSREANLWRALALTAKFATIVAAWSRVRQGLEPISPDPELGHAANFLYMVTGEVPGPQAERTFDACLVLHAEHSFNASTFTARQVASTRAHMYAAVTAAIGALGGALHGGANERVMEMMQAIGSVEQVKPWITSRFERKERVMGMGHAVYKTEDPRARVLRQLATTLAVETGREELLALATEIEQVTREEFRRRKGSELYPNVDFYGAPVYAMLGIDTDLFTAIFAVSRVIGWCSHVIEEKFAEAQPTPALYRPLAEYIGSYCGPAGCQYVPLAKRSAG
ncbi:citrate/2-methylcitrate synthase [Leptolyngbya sp. FACHB-261]|uniref:citrate/2-methylcitrate synthase n=1 Tax=Leptolyngbya sp. FACHB-261 TaxID=2692806 RepID=UPI00168244E0|nr:citrate/2-methylcitrate synthase [Leptolyngbya sp. FACHB-261]MBD2100527.1 citrate (Si)-synthase [Leptolyngbya sp. FACHB-261]